MLHFNEIKDCLKKNDISWKENESMVHHTTFRIGGPAAIFLEPWSEQQISEILRILDEKECAPVIIGRGSNLLVNDHGIDGAVLCLGEAFSEVSISEKYAQEGKVVVFAQSGASLTKLCRFCLEQELTGLEFAYGIPGTIGGAVAMNAGAYGGEMKDVVVGVEHLTMDGVKQELSAAQADFSYRHSYYSDHACCITGAYFALEKGDKQAIRRLMDDYMQRRQFKQPLEFPSAGSTFKRPEGNYASALIDQCGLKGRSVGGAQVSEKHAGFVINSGGATAKDVLDLVDVIKKTVKEKTGYALECEIKLI